MKHRIFAGFTTLLVAAMGPAHFVFVVPATDGATANVFLSEALSPAGAVVADMMAAFQMSCLTSEGEKPLILTKSGAVYTVELPKNARLIHGLLDLGVQQIGSAKQPYVLVYPPRTLLGNPFESAEGAGDDTPVQIVPTGKPSALKLKLLFKGQPQPAAEITVILPDATQ